MRIDELIWDDWNVEHIAGHNVEAEEVEEACLVGSHLARRAGTTSYGLPRFHLFGQTEAGRHLFVVLDREQPHTYYVVTAREMNANEKRQYRIARKRT